MLKLSLLKLLLDIFPLYSMHFMFGTFILKQIMGTGIFLSKSFVCSLYLAFTKLSRPGNSEVTFAIFESISPYYYLSNHNFSRVRLQFKLAFIIRPLNHVDFRYKL